MNEPMEFEWEENSGVWRLYINNFAKVWPDQHGSELAAVLNPSNGKWVGSYWGRCSSRRGGSIPEIDTLEEAKAVALMLIRLDSSGG